MVMIMDLIEKLEPIIIIIAIGIGLLLSNVPFINQNSSYLITIFLFLMIYGLFLEIPISKLKNSYKNFNFTKTSLIINFIWTPLFGYFLGSLFFNNNLDIFIGFFMLILTPCTDWYLLFTKMAKGDVELSLSLLPINLILQIILLPIYLIIFFSTNNSLNYLDLGYSIIIIIVIPFILSQITKKVLKNPQKLADKFLKLQVIFLSIAIFGIFNSNGTILFDNINSIITIFIPLIIFFIGNFTLDLYISQRKKFSYSEYASLTMTTLARNSPLALAIAVNSFPAQELILIALVIGPLIELPVLYIISKILLKIKTHY